MTEITPDPVTPDTTPEKKKSFFIFVKVSARTKQFVKEGAKKYGTMKKYFLSLLQKDGYNLDVNDQ